ncbi:MAG: bifunctional riboflavin kinase/FAD synthetase [Chloroflexota bacterium]|nr:bifunctional riboflavin kinase/FAD synthetase [Chloroflexota bacterium]
MKIISDLTHLTVSLNSVVTIGAFDGVHLGHQALIRRLIARARELRCQAALITFHPHPSEVLTGRRAPRYLTTPEEKAAILGELGVDLLAVLPFTRRMARTSASDFLAQTSSALHMRELWVGPQFALGRDREGDIPALRSLGRRLGFRLRVVEPVTNGGELVTSSRIRELVRSGRVRKAGRLLGRPYSVVGNVVGGDHRGKRLGFPTANLKVPVERLLPSDGVYSGYVWVGDERYRAVMNIGFRPTFDGHEHSSVPRTLEAHLFDFNGDLYGADLKVEFVKYLRSEVKFDSIEALIAQMQEDKAQTQEILTAE